MTYHTCPKVRKKSIFLTIDVLDKPITKTCLYSFDPLKPHFYIVKLEFTGVHIIFLISGKKHRVGTR